MLRMQLFPKRKTDAEYVKQVRRLLSRSKWFGAMHLGFAAFFFLMSWLWWRHITEVGDRIPMLDEAARQGFAIGVSLGTMAGMTFLFTLISLLSALRILTGQRTERLMLKFHDELKKRDARAGHAAESPSREEEEGPAGTGGADG